MIKLEHTDVYGWEAAIRGMRNPMNSWDKSDSDYRLVLGRMCDECGKYELPEEDSCDGCWINDIPYSDSFKVGPNDHELMMRLAKGGSVHAKYRRMITVTVDITAPLYWWKEFDTYKVGTVANSCSTMHKIHAKEFTLDDFSHEHLVDRWEPSGTWKYCLQTVVAHLNKAREKFLETKDKKYWHQMIQLLPTSYNQKRTILLNYEVLVGMYRDRKNHKLNEWVDFCKWIEILPYAEVITCG